MEIFSQLCTHTKNQTKPAAHVEWDEAWKLQDLEAFRLSSKFLELLNYAMNSEEVDTFHTSYEVHKCTTMLFAIRAALLQ